MSAFIAHKGLLAALIEPNVGARLGPWHQRVDAFVEVSLGEAGKEISQVGIGFDAVHLAGADQTGEAGPVSTALVMTGEESVASVNGRAADRVLDEVGVHVDAAIFQEEPEAVLSFQHMDHGLTEIRFARDAGGLGLQPVEEPFDQRARELLPDGATVIGSWPRISAGIPRSPCPGCQTG